jgi:ABC-type metal ion transport system, periplasmic component/surface adhesin
MKINFKNIVVGLIGCIVVAFYPASATVRIVASLPDLGSIASYIGGDKVEVASIAQANANPHSVEVFPSYMAKAARASLFLKCGLALDQWADAIIDGSRNNSLTVIDCSMGIDVLEKPTGKIDASKGDVHPFGNPHYWLDPSNGIVIAQNILEGLKKVDQLNSAFYTTNFEKFKSECDSKIVTWKSQIKPLIGKKIISYHSSWVYFATAFGLTVSGMVEPFPGIPPTGNHLSVLVDLIKKEKCAFLVQEPYFSGDAPNFLNRQTGIPIVKCSPACADVKPASYFSHFDAIINQIVKLTGGK